VAEQAAEETVHRENVKKLDHWIIQKRIYQTDYGGDKQHLRGMSFLQIAQSGGELLEGQHNSYIVDMVSQQLKVRKQIESEHAHALLMMAQASPSPFTSSKSVGTFESPKAQQKGGGDTGSKFFDAKVNSELVLELQALRLKKELACRKAEEKRLRNENGALMKQIQENKAVCCVENRSSSRRTRLSCRPSTSPTPCSTPDRRRADVPSTAGAPIRLAAQALPMPFKSTWRSERKERGKATPSSTCKSSWSPFVHSMR
jgi:hypothetical protein